MSARSFQAMVPMRDGTRLNTFVFLPDDGGSRWPVTRAFKLPRAAEDSGGEEEVKSPWYLSHGDARGDSIMQVFENKEAAIDAACAVIGKGAYVFEVGPIQEGHGGIRRNGAEIRRIFDERARITG